MYSKFRISVYKANAGVNWTLMVSKQHNPVRKSTIYTPASADFSCCVLLTEAGSFQV